MSDKQKKQISEYHTGRIGKLCVNSKGVVQYDLNGCHIEDWDCTLAVRRRFGWNDRNIAAVCRGDRNKSHGYVWRFKGDSFSKYDVKGSGERLMKPVNQYTKEGTLVQEWKSIKDAAESNPKWTAHNLSCCIRKNFNAYGFRWEFKNEIDKTRSLKNKKC